MRRLRVAYPAPCWNFDGGTICTTIGGHGLSAGEKATIGGVGLKSPKGRADRRQIVSPS